MRTIIAILALAFTLGGCLEKELSDFDRCERNGLKIGSDDFKRCEADLDARRQREAQRRLIEAEIVWRREQREREIKAISKDALEAEMKKRGLLK